MNTLKLTDCIDFTGETLKPFDGSRLFLSTGALQGTEINIDALENVTYESRPSRANINVTVGDIVFAKMQNTIKVLRISEETKDLIVSTGFFVVRPRKNIHEEFLLHLLCSKEFNSQKDKLCSGATQKAITNTGLKRIMIPDLDTCIQERAGLSLSKIRVLIKKRQEQVSILDKLTIDVFMGMFGSLKYNPMNWPLKKLGTITTKITDGKHGDCTNEANSGFYFLGAREVSNGLLHYKNARQITEADFHDVDRRTNLQPGDLVVVNTGATIGKTAIVPDSPLTRKTIFQKSVAIITVKPNELNVRFLKHAYDIFTDLLTGVSSGSAQKNLLLSQMRNTVLPTPPVEFQNEFAAIVQVIEQQKAALNASLIELETIYKATLQKAFNGELFQ